MLITSKHRRRRARRVAIKRFLPTSLFARALLILLVPVMLLQLLVAHIFFDRHWNSVVRNMSTTTAADIAMLTHEYRELSYKLGTREALAQTKNRGQFLGIDVVFKDDERLVVQKGSGRDAFPEFYDILAETLQAPLTILPSQEDRIRLRVNADHGVLEFNFARKRLASATTMIFIFWMVGSAVLLTTIAILFLRNQVRPIVQLARAAEQFGLGQEVDNFSPRGASEVRRAGRAFLIMAERTRRQVLSRTEMLAGISHDLRTPLTRMTLELEMGKIDPATRDALTAEIAEMREMIDEYLDFARGDAGEVAEPTDLILLLTDITAAYRRGGANVTFAPDAGVQPQVMLKPQAIRRAITNIVDNALRYGGGQAQILLEQSLTFMRIKIVDRGAGIPAHEHEAVFKPFTRLEPSRNTQTGGVGLGLSIARAVAHSHGGEISLENLRDEGGTITGLEVTFRLPREVQGLS